MMGCYDKVQFLFQRKAFVFSPFTQGWFFD